jgi:hypothetical protein
MIVRCLCTTIGLIWGKGNEMRGGEQGAGVPHQDFGIARQGYNPVRVRWSLERRGIQYGTLHSYGICHCR